jgi:outer membrane protein assembly factor BamB
MAGLTSDNTLILIDHRAPMVEKQVRVTGVDGTLVGIDVRPSNGKLYGVATDNALYTIDADTGRATKVVAMNKSFPLAGRAIVDFNPVANRLRLMSSDGTSFRVNVDTGEVAVDGSHNYDKTAAWANDKPMVVAGAYTNSFAGTKATELINLDMTQGMLMLQAPPNDGTLKAIGKLGVKADAFDIWSDGNGGNMAMAVAGDTLYTIDLKSGAGTAVGAIKGLRAALIDIAVLPGK